MSNPITSAFASRKILLVDDDEELRQMYAAHLTAQGFAVEEAEDTAGARKAFEEITDVRLRDKWLAKPFLGIDGMPKTGQSWVMRGLFAATIITPPNSGEAIKMLAESLRSHVMPPEKSLTPAKSFPALEELAKKVGGKAQAARR